MMDIKVFQEKLAQVLELAIKNEKVLARQEIEQFFAEDGLSEEQLNKVYAYLGTKGVTVKGASIDVRALHEPTQKKGEAAPFTAEEKDYLKVYEKEMQGKEIPDAEREALFGWARAGQAEASKRLMEAYLPEVVRAAKELHTEGVFIGDMIQEGNIALVEALQSWQDMPRPHQWICGQIQEGICRMLEQQDMQKYQDHVLVEKVRNLEAAVKELSDGDEDTKFSIEELSVFLDMSVEEIQDVLRLTGDDK